MGWLLAVGEVVDAISGGGGWVGTGLLGSVLAWIMFIHLPAKDKQLKEVGDGFRTYLDGRDQLLAKIITDKDRVLVEQVTAKDLQITALLEHKWVALQGVMAENGNTIKALSADFKGAVQALSSHCDSTEERLMRLIERYESRLNPEQKAKP